MKELKALEILKKFSAYCESAYGFNGAMIASLGDINEAIAELEALQAPKTCDGCEYLGYSIIMQSETCNCKYECTRFKLIQAKLYPDMYKTKAQ